MSIKVINHAEHIARKEYRDDGWEWFSEWINYGCHTGDKKLTFSEGRAIIKARDSEKPYMIKPGDKYVSQFNKYEGSVYTWRMKFDLYEIACKYNIFPEC